MSETVRSIASFDLERELGRGGMGVVWLGRDRRLGRRVAVKMLRDDGDTTARERLRREARAAASINHPNVCQVYEVGEEGGVLYIAMELLEGESLAERLAAGPLALEECVSIVTDVLAALEVIHGRGLVHRDVKPSNVFLTRYGAKLLDFGLARGDEATAPEETRMALTQEGAALGTPRYMAPEQWRGGPVGPAADLWATGVVLYEMLSGRAAFEGHSVGELYDAIVHREPPALAGGPAVVAADRVVQRALQKRPEDRFAAAAAMAEAVKAARGGGASPGAEPVRVRRLTRLIVLPFRPLRPDPETDFLSVSLPDAISGALASIDSLVVRSRIFAGASAGDPDLKAMAREAGVDAVLTGTLLRGGDRVRVTAQLVEAPSGTVAWSRSVEGALGDLFALQDSLVHEILESLTVKLSRGEEERLGRGAAGSARAYELYLRGNQVAVSWVQESGLLAARDLYRACLDLDPAYAPAWARVARVYRVLSKYGFGDTEERYRRGRQAIARALELDPDLSLAHHVYTYFQVEEGEARAAMRRLLERARTRGNDPETFAGLVPALRFCGLLEESVAAHDRARRLDPAIRTGVTYTYYAMGDHERAMAADDETPPYCRFLSLDQLGRADEALACLRAEATRDYQGLEAVAVRMTLAAMEQDRGRVREHWDRLRRMDVRDPEGSYLMTRNLARVGEVEMALAGLQRVVERGFHCPSTMETDPWLEPLRTEPEFFQLVDRARAGRAVAEAEFVRLGGGEVLGLTAARGWT